MIKSMFHHGFPICHFSWLKSAHVGWSNPDCVYPTVAGWIPHFLLRPFFQMLGDENRIFTSLCHVFGAFKQVDSTSFMFSRHMFDHVWGFLWKSWLPNFFGSSQEAVGHGHHGWRWKLNTFWSERRGNHKLVDLSWLQQDLTIQHEDFKAKVGIWPSKNGNRKNV
jgi:hypothetical protein